MTVTYLIGGSRIRIFRNPFGVLLRFLTLITIKGYIPRTGVAFLGDVVTGINTCLRPWVPVASLPLTSSSTCAMWGTIALYLDIPVAAVTVTANLRNIKVLPRVPCGSGLEKIRDMTRALGKVRPKAIRVTNDGILSGIEDAVSDTIQEVTNFLVLAPRVNIMPQLFSTNLDKGPLVVQSKLAVNIERPAEITGFALVSQSGYIFLLALGSKKDNGIIKKG